MLNIKSVEEIILNGELDNKFDKLYGENIEARERYLNIIKGFKNTFGDEREIELFSAPGRTEIIGNHTDHQRGLAIAASVNLDIIGAVAFNSDNIIRVKSEKFEGIDEVSVDNLDVNEKEYGTSKALIRGCARKFEELGYKIGGFDLYTSSNVLKGSGLSSSAAFEVLIATVMNNLFCSAKEDSVSIAKIGKFSENVYFNKPSGLLDQTASSVGGFVYMDFKDQSEPYIERISLNLKEYGYSLFVVDTGGNHAALTSEYAQVSDDLKSVCDIFSKEVLRDVDENEFIAKLPLIKDKLSHRAILRAFHVFDENKRVEQYKNALEAKDIDKILALVKESGDSSFKFLQNTFSVSDMTSQGIILGLYISNKILGNKGASRVHGGGFAGTIQAYVPDNMAVIYKKEMERVFGKGKCYKLYVRQSGGTKII